MPYPEKPIILYTSRFCIHSRAVERFMKDHHIPIKQFNIDGDLEARNQVMTINNGYASVPTLVFPDGTTLTEPSFRQLRARLGINRPNLVKKIRGLFGD